MSAAAPRLRSSSAPDFPTTALHGYLSALLGNSRDIERTLRAHILPYLPTLADRYAVAANRRNDARRMRVAVVGGPRTGKSTAARALADAHGLPLRHADDLIPLGWSRASEQLAHEIRLSDGGIFEGVAIARALRKLLELEPGQPLDAVVRMREPYAALTPGQAAMSAGHDRVLEAILPELELRGVRVLELPAQGLTARAALTFAASAGITPRLDARDPLLGELFTRARAAHRFDIRTAALLAGQRVDEHVRETLERQVGEALGLSRYQIRAALAPPIRTDAIRTDARRKKPAQKLAAIDPLTPGGPIAEKLDKFVKSNVARVGSMTDGVYADVEASVRKGLEQGLRPDALAARILSQNKSLSETQATIIANDAVGKFHGAQTQLRQQSLGVTHYRWRTVRDLKVRPGHRALEGTTQAWDSPPVTNSKTGKRAHPGFDTHYYACRCSASPIIDPATIAPPPDSPFARKPGAPPTQLPLPSVPAPTVPRRFPVRTEPAKPARAPRVRRRPLAQPAPDAPVLMQPPPTAPIAPSSPPLPVPPAPTPLPPTAAPAVPRGLPVRTEPAKPARAPRVRRRPLARPAPDAPLLTLPPPLPPPIPAADQTLLAPLEYGVSDAQLAYLREGMRDLTVITSAYVGATPAEVDLIATGQTRTQTGQAFEPIVISVEPGYMELTDGRHRMAAARAAGATRILARIKTPGGREYLRVIPIPR
jgi:SPP1 gp7 family putative phage head morphogenesis protein